MLIEEEEEDEATYKLIVVLYHNYSTWPLHRYCRKLTSVVGDGRRQDGKWEEECEDRGPFRRDPSSALQSNLTEAQANLPIYLVRDTVPILCGAIDRETFVDGHQ